MHQRTPTGSKTTPSAKATHADGARQCLSWIDQFVAATDNLHAPAIFRRWAAISGIASALEQKVWLTTSSPIYPNLYIWLTGHPGTGKTRTLRAMISYVHELPEFKVAPKSFTFASLVDALAKAKVVFVDKEQGNVEYNTLTINADEIGTFMSKYDKELGDGLSAFYDPDPYGHERRGNDIKIKIKRPQINMGCGATPTTLMEVIPEGAWGQGLMSRVIMIYSDERTVGDDFASVTRERDPKLIADLTTINSLRGEFKVTEDYRNLVLKWRELGEAPLPNHPRLIHYNARRRVNLYKLSMISAVDQANELLLTRNDFNRAMGWLLEAEKWMPDIFKAGVMNADAAAIEDIYHFVLTRGHRDHGLPEVKIVNFAKDLIPIHSIMRIVEIMVQTGKIELVGKDRITGQNYYKACLPDIDSDGELV
jgi:hypothetical protein